MSLTELDHKMIAVAKRRGIIRLDTGDLAQLIAWKPTKCCADGSRKRKGNYMRVEYQSGKRATVRITRLAEVES